MNEKSKTQTNSAIKDNLFTNQKDLMQNLEDINFNNLTKEENNFKKNLEKLLTKLNSEQNKYNAIKSDLEKSHENLMNISIKQITIYVEEMEKLNTKLKEKEDILKVYKNKVEENHKKENGEKDLNYYKNILKFNEKKLAEKTLIEEKLKKENESYKRQINFYKDKLKVDYLNPIKKLDQNNNNNNQLKLKSPIKNYLNINNNTNNLKGKNFFSSKAEAYKISKKKNKMNYISCNFFNVDDVKQNSQTKPTNRRNSSVNISKNQSLSSSSRNDNEISVGKIPLFTTDSPNEINKEKEKENTVDDNNFQGKLLRKKSLVENSFILSNRFINRNDKNEILNQNNGNINNNNNEGK